MLDQILRRLAQWLGLALINYSNPQLKAEIDGLFKARDVQAVKDIQTRVEAAKIEDQVVAREQEVVADQEVVAQNKAEIINAQDALTTKLKKADEAQSIEEVLSQK